MISHENIPLLLGFPVQITRGYLLCNTKESHESHHLVGCTTQPPVRWLTHWFQWLGGSGSEEFPNHMTLSLVVGYPPLLLVSFG